MNKAYGRLDIFWPEGRLETFVLREPTVTVGRAAENHLVLDYDGVDALHLRIEHSADGVVMTPVASEMETFVDGVAAPPREPVILRGGEEIQLGSLRVVYRTVDDTATVPLSAPVEDTQRFESDSATFRIELQLPQITVVPGSYISVELSITNTGRESERYTVDMQGVPQSWVRVNRPMLVIDPGDTSLVMINLRPIRHSDSRPGEYPVTVTVTPDRAPQSALRAQLAVRVQPFSGFGIALSSPRVANAGTFRLHLHNHGSAPVVLRLTALDRFNQLNLRLSQLFAQLGPGERMVVTGAANARDKRVFGPAEEYPFEIVAQADGPPGFTVAVTGKVIDRPPMPGWSRLAALAGVLLAIALIAYGLWGLIANRQVTPVIDRFMTDTQEAVRGQPVRLEWSVRDADSLMLLVNGGEPEPLPERTNGSRIYDTTTFETDTTFTLVALNGDERVEQQTSLSVYTPVNIDALEVSPPLVFRNVVQTLTILWSAEGYQGTPSLQGLETLGQPARIELSPDQQAVQVGPVLPMSNFTVRLLMTDERGVEVERTEDVILTDPQCTSARADVPLFVAPDGSAAILSRLPQGVARIVTGRTTGADYLAVRLENGGEGWARTADFVCPTELFRVADLREIPVLPDLTPGASQTLVQPPLTLIPTSTLTPTMTPSLTPTITPTPSPSATVTPRPSPTVPAVPLSPVATATVSG